MKYLGRALGQLLIDEGLCPKDATDIELQVPVAGPLMLRYEVLVDSEDIPKIVRALTALAQIGQRKTP